MTKEARLLSVKMATFCCDCLLALGILACTLADERVQRAALCQIRVSNSPTNVSLKVLHPHEIIRGNGALRTCSCVQSEAYYFINEV